MARISNLDFYAILGVHPNAEDIVIRAAFKALAQRYHPDRFNGSKDEAHRRMSDLTSAYETLADPARRRKYDRRRGLASRQARFYFKNPARDGHQHFGALAARAAARKAQRYRMAVYVLMVIVVILSGFNVHQHAAQIKGLFAWNRPSSGTISVAAPGTVTPSTPEATVDAASSSAPPTSTTANVRILPIGQGSSRPITSNALESPAPEPQASVPQASVPQASVAPSPAPEPVVAAPRAPEPPVATSLPAPVETVKAPVPAPEATVASPSPAPASTETTKAPARAPAVEPRKAAVASTTAAPASDPAHKDTKRPAAPPKPVVAKAVEPERPAATPKPVVAKSVEPERPAAPPPAPADANRCTASVAALGLCNITVQGH